MALQSAMEQNDGEIVRRTLSGESQAFGRLVEKYQGLIYGLAYNKIGNTADAQDIAQDVFVRAFRKLSQLDDPNCFSAWIKTITANECKTWLRNLRPTVSLDESEYSPAHDSAAQSIWRYDEFRTEVAQAIQALSERNREVITLYYLSGMTCEEIAESLETTPSAVQSRLHRARQLLKAEFTGEIEQVLGRRGLPDGFSSDVLKRVTLHPIHERCLHGHWGDGTDVGCLFLGVRQEPDGPTKLIALSIPSPDARGIAYPLYSEHLGETYPELIDAQLAEYRARGMELQEVMLCLDEHDHCVAHAVFRQGRARVREMVRPGRAIALANRAPAPMLAEDRVVELREVGENGLHYELRRDLDSMLVGMRPWVGISAFTNALFAAGVDVEKGFGVARISRDMEQRTVRFDIDGLEGSSGAMGFGDDPIWVDHLWKIAGEKLRATDDEPGDRRYWVDFSLDGGDVRMTFSFRGPGDPLSI